MIPYMAVSVAQVKSTPIEHHLTPVREDLEILSLALFQASKSEGLKTQKWC